MTIKNNGDAAWLLKHNINLKRIRALAIGCLLCLIVLSVFWELWLAPLRPNGSWLVLKALPLCFPLTGLLKNKMFTYRWVSLMVWIYFAEGIVRAYGDPMPSQMYASIEIILCLLLFFACAVHVRYRIGFAKKRNTIESKPSGNGDSLTDSVS